MRACTCQQEPLETAEVKAPGDGNGPGRAPQQPSASISGPGSHSQQHTALLRARVQANKSWKIPFHKQEVDQRARAMHRGQIPDPGEAGLGAGAGPGGKGALTVEPTRVKHQDQAAQELKEAAPFV